MIFGLHWSDSNQTYGTPFHARAGKLKLGMPFLYIIADDLEHAEQISKRLPNVHALMKYPTLYKAMEQNRTHIFFGFFPTV